MSSARPRRAGRDIGLVGRIERVDVDVLNHVAEDYIPVDRVGRAPTARASSHNVNADEAAGAVAAALRAHKLIYLTDVPGWLRDPADHDSLITQTRVDELLAALDGVSGGMRPKLAACVAAIQGGVSFAHIVDGRVSHSLLLELFTDAGVGTKVLPAGTPT